VEDVRVDVYVPSPLSTGELIWLPGSLLLSAGFSPGSGAPAVLVIVVVRVVVETPSATICAGSAEIEIVAGVPVCRSGLLEDKVLSVAVTVTRCGLVDAVIVAVYVPSLLSVTIPTTSLGSSVVIVGTSPATPFPFASDSVTVAVVVDAPSAGIADGESDSEIELAVDGYVICT
jgi:hypothetical protein